MVDIPVETINGIFDFAKNLINSKLVNSPEAILITFDLISLSIFAERIPTGVEKKSILHFFA